MPTTMTDRQKMLRFGSSDIVSLTTCKPKQLTGVYMIGVLSEEVFWIDHTGICLGEFLNSVKIYF